MENPKSVERCVRGTVTGARANIENESGCRDALPDLDAVAERARKGNRDAFRDLVLALSPTLYRFFCRRGSRNPEDLSQKTWLRVVQNLHCYDPSRSFATWVFAIAYRLWVDEMRIREPASLNDRIGDLSAEDPDVEQELLAQERIAGLRQCLHRLSEEERTILRLRYWKGLALDEVANELGMGYGSIKGKAHRAAMKLRKCLESKGFRQI